MVKTKLLDSVKGPSHLPKCHHIVRCPAKNKSQDQHAGHFHCLNLSSPYDPMATGVHLVLATQPELLRSPVDDQADGQVAHQHH